MDKLMNEENEWDHGISPEVKEGPADCVIIGGYWNSVVIEFL